MISMMTFNLRINITINMQYKDSSQYDDCMLTSK